MEASITNKKFFFTKSQKRKIRKNSVKEQQKKLREKQKRKWRKINQKKKKNPFSRELKRQG